MTASKSEFTEAQNIILKMVGPDWDCLNDRTWQTQPLAFNTLKENPEVIYLIGYSRLSRDHREHVSTFVIKAMEVEMKLWGPDKVLNGSDKLIATFTYILSQSDIEIYKDVDRILNRIYKHFPDRLKFFLDSLRKDTQIMS